jgi:hypothetical protein
MSKYDTTTPPAFGLQNRPFRHRNPNHTCAGFATELCCVEPDVPDPLNNNTLGAHVRISVNTADDPAAGRLYLTVTGTSAEAGDDGEAGRGNRRSPSRATVCTS